MERIRSWFKNMGQKIEMFAMIMFIVNSVIFALVGLVIIFFGIKQNDFKWFILSIFIAASAVILGILLSYVGQWLLYGFGVLVENAELSMEKEKNKSVQHMKTEQIQHMKTEQIDLKKIADNLDTVRPKAPGWTCPNCGEQNPDKKDKCEICGNLKMKSQ